MVIKDEEELRRRIEEGWWISRDSAGVKLKDPRTGRSERVAKELEPLAIALHEGRRSADGQGPQEGPATEEDVRQIVGLMRQRVDSRAPILQKWVNDIAWWQHVTNDTSAKLLPDLLSMLSPGEIDLEDPEKTVDAIVRRYKELRSKAQEAEAVAKRCDAALRAYMDRARKLEGELREYQEAYNQLGDLYDALVESTRKTLYYITEQVPLYLPEDARLTYRVLLSKVSSFWEQVAKKALGQGEGGGQRQAVTGTSSP